MVWKMDTIFEKVREKISQIKVGTLDHIPVVKYSQSVRCTEQVLCFIEEKENTT